jgi:hypothetical protein
MCAKHIGQERFTGVIYLDECYSILDGEAQGIHNLE